MRVIKPVGRNVQPAGQAPANQSLILKASDITNLLRQRGMPHPAGIEFSNVAEKYQAKDAGPQYELFLGAVAEKITGCNSRLGQPWREYDAADKELAAFYKQLDPYFAKATRQLTKEHVMKCANCQRKLRYRPSSEELEARVNLLVPIELKEAGDRASDAKKAKYAVVDGIIKEKKHCERLYNNCILLMKSEKELLAKRRECAELEAKIDGYPDSAVAANARIADLNPMLDDCRCLSELAKEKLDLQRGLERAKEDVEKVERHGKTADRTRVDEKTAEIKAIDDEIARAESSLRNACGSSISARPSEIQITLTRELEAAKNLVENYDLLLSKDLNRLEALSKRAMELDAAFAMQQSALQEEARKAGLEFSF